MAYLELYPALTDQPLINVEQLEKMLNEEGLLFGIDHAICKESIEKVKASNEPLHMVPVARGMLPIDGKDSTLRFELEIGPIPGKLLRNGTIDFRERKIFTGVDEGQLIAQKVPATPGTPGMNVLGEPLAQKPGKNIDISISGDVSYDPDNGQFFATKSGVLSVVTDLSMQVCNKQIIEGDVDYSVGNVESKDCIEIKGSVKPGFNVKTKGDIQVDCNLETATIHCQGNAVIKGGLLGKGSLLKTGGDADINFTEHGEIISSGSVTLRKGSYYSIINAEGAIYCAQESTVLGGDICCGESFVGGRIGSKKAKPCSIAAGVDPQRYQSLITLRQQVEELEEKLDVLLVREGENLEENSPYRRHETQLQDLQIKAKKLNLIPNTPLYSRKEPLFDLSNAKITVHEKIAIGTKLRIGNKIQILKEEFSKVEFVIDQNLGQIVARNLQK